MTTRRRWATWCISMWKVFSGLCTTITAEWHHGAGSITITTLLVSQVRIASVKLGNERVSPFCFPDLRNVEKMTFNFELGTPFRPYEQLMGVLPVASMEHIPLAYRVCLVDTFLDVGLLIFRNTGSDVRCEFNNFGLLSLGIRTRSEWKEAGLGSYCEDPVH